MADQGQFQKGQFVCQWQVQPFGLSLKLTLGEGLGSVCLGEALLPTAQGGPQPEKLAESYARNVIKALRDACSAAWMDSGSTNTEPIPAEAKPTVEYPVLQVPPRPEAQKSAPAHGTRVLFSVHPTPRTSPVRFGFGGETFEVERWRGIPAKVCSYLASVAPEKLRDALEDDLFKGYKHRTMSPLPTALRNPMGITIDGKVVGYLEVAMSSRDLLFHTAKLLRYCGIDTTDAWYETR